FAHCAASGPLVTNVRIAKRMLRTGLAADFMVLPPAILRLLASDPAIARSDTPGDVDGRIASIRHRCSLYSVFFGHRCHYTPTPAIPCCRLISSEEDCVNPSSPWRKSMRDKFGDSPRNSETTPSLV